MFLLTSGGDGAFLAQPFIHHLPSNEWPSSLDLIDATIRILLWHHIIAKELTLYFL